ncbi:MAG: hypothetical protein ACLT2T_01495 [Bilophila wadsworthia]
MYQTGHPAASGECRAQGVHFRDRPRGTDHASYESEEQLAELLSRLGLSVELSEAKPE